MIKGIEKQQGRWMTGEYDQYREMVYRRQKREGCERGRKEWQVNIKKGQRPEDEGRQG